MSTTLRPFTPVKPGELLEEELEARGWSQGDLATVLGRPVQAVNEIIAGKKAITPETAVALSGALGTSAEYWLNLEASYRLDLLQQRGMSGVSEVERRARLFSKVPLKELVRLGWLRADLGDLDQAEAAVCQFLEIDRIEEEPRLPFAARKAERGVPHSPAQVAWMCQVRRLASAQKVDKYRRDELAAAIEWLARCSATEEETRRVPGLLARVGVRFVVAPPLAGTRIDGATAWLDGGPVVAISFRYDRVDWFWFTLMHELSHVLSGDGAEGAMIDEAMVGTDADADSLSAVERRADRQATGWLVSEEKLKAFIRRTRPRFGQSAIVEFAVSLGIHPAIIVGQLQKRGEIPYTHHRNLLGKTRHLFEQTGRA